MVPEDFGRDWLQWRSWLKKLEYLKMMQSFGWWSKPSGRLICLPWSKSKDQLLMWNLQIQFIKLIFFSSLMTKRLYGLENAISMHWQLLMLQADSSLLNLPPQEILLRFVRAFQTICKRGPLRWPKVLQVDLGREFMGYVTWEMTKHDVRLRGWNAKVQSD